MQFEEASEKLVRLLEKLVAKGTLDAGLLGHLSNDASADKLVGGGGETESDEPEVVTVTPGSADMGPFSEAATLKRAFAKLVASTDDVPTLRNAADGVTKVLEKLQVPKVDSLVPQRLNRELHAMVDARQVALDTMRSLSLSLSQSAFKPSGPLAASEKYDLDAAREVAQRAAANDPHQTE